MLVPLLADLRWMRRGAKLPFAIDGIGDGANGALGCPLRHEVNAEPPRCLWREAQERANKW